LQRAALISRRQNTHETLADVAMGLGKLQSRMSALRVQLSYTSCGRKKEPLFFCVHLFNT